MTLARQLIIALAVLFLFLFAGNVVVSVVNMQTLVEEQMEIHAQDTATSVAISMTQATQASDQAALDTLFNAVSDSGFYERIYFRDLKGRIILDRTFPLEVQGVPGWFVNQVELSGKQGRAEVNSGWVRLGEVVVVSHPGKAYARLWDVLVLQFFWFTGITLVTCLLAYLALKWLLIPLRRVEEQANTICKQEFSVQEKVPKTRELRRVVEAMNRMSLSLQASLDGQMDLIRRLQAMAYRDPVTGLSNRADFDARLTGLTTDPAGPHSGALYLFAFNGISEINELSGRSEGNSILMGFGEVLARELANLPGALLARRQGLEFAVLLEDIDQADAATMADKLFVACSAYLQSLESTINDDIYMGFTYQSCILDASLLLQEGDAALRHARLNGGSQWADYASIDPPSTAPLVIRTLKQWQAFICESLEGGSFNLSFQTVFDAQTGRPVGAEVFTRFMDGDSALSTSIILPFAERLGLAEAIDKKVLLSLVENRGFDEGTYYAVNLSHRSFRSASFRQWIDEFLTRYPQCALHLVFEASETVIHQSESDVRRFQSCIEGHGARLAVDHFGLQSSSFSYLHSLPLAYLKIHRSFISGIDGNLDNQFYLKSLRLLTKSRGIALVAEGVETEAEFHTLKELGADNVQGYYLVAPEPVH